MHTINLEAGDDGVYRADPNTNEPGNGDGPPNNGGSGNGEPPNGGRRQQGAGPGDFWAAWENVSFYNKRFGLKIIKLSIAIIGVVCAMAAINGSLGPGYNIPFFIFTSILYIGIVVAPIPALVLAITGLLIALLASSKTHPRDLSQGALQGLKFLIGEILPKGLLAIQVTVGFLATFPLGNGVLDAIGTTLFILCGSSLILILFHVFKLGGERWFAWSAVAYTAAFMAFALFSDFGPVKLAMASVKGVHSWSSSQADYLETGHYITDYQDGDLITGLTPGNPVMVRVHGPAWGSAKGVKVDVPLHHFPYTDKKTRIVADYGSTFWFTSCDGEPVETLVSLYPNGTPYEDGDSC